MTSNLVVISEKLGSSSVERPDHATAYDEHVLP